MSSSTPRGGRVSVTDHGWPVHGRSPAVLSQREREVLELVAQGYTNQQIADYLGLTIETVSRTLTQLQKTATIELPSSRRILLCNRSALSRLNA